MYEKILRTEDTKKEMAKGLAWMPELLQLIGFYGPCGLGDAHSTAQSPGIITFEFIRTMYGEWIWIVTWAHARKGTL